MAKKTSPRSSTPADEKFQSQDFDLFAALEALDRKDYGWFSRLTEEQRRKFVPYMLVQWMSSVKSGGVLSSYYLLSVDSAANRHLFSEGVTGHPELQWLMLCASSPGMGKQRHQWIPQLPSGSGNLKTKLKTKDVLDYFGKIYPGADSSQLSVAAGEWTAAQNQKYRLASLEPTLKLQDIEVLSAITTPEQIDEYERRSGN